MQRLLFLIAWMFVMVFGGYGEASAAPFLGHDRMEKVEHKEDHHDAVLSDLSTLYRICNSRPHRLAPTWHVPIAKPGSKLPFSYSSYQSRFTLYGGTPRQETAPIHFDVASKYYVICLRHLLC